VHNQRLEKMPRRMANVCLRHYVDVRLPPVSHVKPHMFIHLRLSQSPQVILRQLTHVVPHPPLHVVTYVDDLM
jgi:hypothetical protein